MFATAVTLALFAAVGLLLRETLRGNGMKMLAALRGRSWASNLQPSPAPISVRFSQRYPAARPARSRVEWRAAA